MPLNAASLSSLVEAICITQDAIGRQILIENPSSYFSAPDSTISEAEFITCVARQSGCGLLVDVNNVYVSAHNLVFDADDYLNALPASLIGEIHLAGHTREQAHGDDILLDSHGTPVSEPVWALYARLLARTGAIPTLIERDNAIPTWRDLAAEATRADQIAAALHPRQRSVAN